MPVQPQYNTRSGATQFLRFAQTLCRLVGAAAPVIRGRYPDRTDLLAVLTLAENMCALLPAAIAEAAAADAMTPEAFDPPASEPFPGQTS